MPKYLRNLICLHLLLGAGLANATPTTWSFGGTVAYGYGIEANGRKVEGSITLNLEAAQNGCGGYPRETDFYICLVKTNGGNNMYASAFDGIQKISVAEEANAGGTNIAVYRNSVAGYGDYNSYYVGASNSTTAIDLLIQDSLGTNSNIFTDETGGVRWDQPINWFPNYSNAQIRINSGSYYEVAMLDWITTTINGVSVTQTRPQSSSEIPEPATSAILAVGLMALLSSFRRRHTKKP